MPLAAATGGILSGRVLVVRCLYCVYLCWSLEVVQLGSHLVVAASQLSTSNPARLEQKNVPSCHAANTTPQGRRATEQADVVRARASIAICPVPGAPCLFGQETAKPGTTTRATHRPPSATTSLLAPLPARHDSAFAFTFPFTQLPTYPFTVIAASSLGPRAGALIALRRIHEPPRSLSTPRFLD